MTWPSFARTCRYCGEVGGRTQVLGGFAHKRCIPKEPKPGKPKADECCVGGPLWSNCTTCPKRPSKRRERSGDKRED